MFTTAITANTKWGEGKELGREPGKRTIEAHYAQATHDGTYHGCLAVSDFRELCDRSDLDAIIVATPDHWHAFVALTALQKGKDVYCEKPVTHHFAEGERLVREVAERKAIFQVGSQQRSDPEFRQAVEVVRNGRLGTIERVEVGLNTGYRQAQRRHNHHAPAGWSRLSFTGAARLPFCRICGPGIIAGGVATELLAAGF